MALKGALLTPQVRHLPAIIEAEELRKLLTAIDGYSGYPSTVGALKISPHLFQRPGKIRKRKWADLDLDACRWSVPAEDMKQRQVHEVALSHQAVAMIREMQELQNGPYVFSAFHTGQRPISENTANDALKRMGFKGVTTAHGFRSTASAILNESGKWS